MQDFQSIPGLSGRIFSAGAGGMDNRRLRGYPSSSPSPPAPVKCPRCESANTKFCYYNNYNLSQPRHFCKACRRYWTKGGVLRNVPVGGGCRKNSSKRSSSSSAAAAAAGGGSKPSKSSDKARRRPPVSGGSSSDSSTLTANDPSGGALFTSQTSNPNPSPSPPPAYDPAAMEPISQGPEIYGQDAGSFTTLMASAAVPPPSPGPPTMLGFGYAHHPPPPAPTMSAFRLPQDQKAAGMIDPTVQLDLPPFHGRSGGGGGMEWGTADPTALFDLTACSVDPAVYWNQTHWGDTDPSSLYLP